MIKFTYTLLLLLFSVSFFGQNIINTSKTPQHQEVRGSKIQMVPPEGFKYPKNFKGFEQLETNSNIMVLDMPNSFSEIKIGLTKENLLKQGIFVESIEAITFNNLNGILIKSEQKFDEVMYRKYIFAFGTDKETIFINGLAPKNNVKLDKQILSSLLSVVYDEQKVLTPLDAVDFEITTSDTNFVFAKSMTNMLVYNCDGKMPTETKDNASIVIAKAFSKVEITNKEEFAKNTIQTLPVQIHKINTVFSIEINGLQGYEITAEGVSRKTGKSGQVYQVMLFAENNSYYILFGSSEANFEANLASFKKIARTFKIK